MRSIYLLKNYLKNLLFFYLIKYKTRFIYLLSIFSMTIRKDNISYFYPPWALGLFPLLLAVLFYMTLFLDIFSVYSDSVRVWHVCGNKINHDNDKMC